MAAKTVGNIRVAISGLGWVAAHRHLPCFRSAGAEIVAAYRPSDEIRPKGFQIVEEYEQLFDFSPDIVSICSPPFAHAEQTIKALERGCHVLVEKPMAMDMAEAQRMADAARQNGRILTVAHSHLFDRSVMRAIKEVESGGIGELTAVQALFLRGGLRPGKPWLFKMPGGLVFDELPHPLYLLERFLGPATIENSYVHPVAGRATPRQLHVTLRGPRASGQITVVMDSAVSEWNLVLIGTERLLVADLFRDVLTRIHRRTPMDGVRAAEGGG